MVRSGETSTEPITIGWGGFIKAIRFCSQTTQHEFGSGVGVTQQTVARWEKGGRLLPNRKNIIAVKLGLVPEELHQLDEGAYQPSIPDESYVIPTRSMQSSEIVPVGQEGSIPHILGAFALRIQSGPPLNENEVMLVRELIGLGRQE